MHDATTDEATICRWWSEAAIANVGIATGNGLLVFDIDAKHGGLESLAQLEAQHGPLPQTPTVSTGGGGRHYYFRLPDGMAVGNRAGLATGIDVRGDNGYVVAPPSLHASGSHYQWTIPPDVLLAEPSPWLLELLGCSDSQSEQNNSNGVMLKAQPAWKADCITNGLSSGEGLIWAVRDPVEATEPVKEKGKITGYQTVIKDSGVTDKRLLVIEPEFAQMFKVLRREGNTLSPVVRQAWDSGVLTAMTKNNFAKAGGTHVSILGHITRPELEKSLCDTDCFNGFANRFLWALVRRSKLLPDGGRGLDLAPLRQRITTALTTAKGITAMHRSPAARALWHELYPELTAERPGLYGAVVGRGEAQTLRLRCSMPYSTAWT